MSDMNEMKTELTILQNEYNTLKLRQLIELGRQKCCDLYLGEYHKNYPQKVKVEQIDYDSVSNQPIMSYIPYNYSDFIEYVKSKPNEQGKAYLEILKGGRGSEYSKLSASVHDCDSKTIALFVLSSKNTSYENLFTFAFNVS
jgi:hypothetical protein